MIKTKRQAFAQHFDFDLAETEDYRYHYGRTSQPVWAFDSAYYCVTKKGEKPAKYNSGGSAGYEDWWKWEAVQDNYVNGFGFIIWKAPTE